MFFLENYYLWASEGCPDAVPAGVIAIDLGMNGADFSDTRTTELRNELCSEGFFDDAPLQLGFTGEDKALICREEGPNFLCSSQVVADWQWALMKQQPGLRTSEFNLAEYMQEVERFMEEHGDED